MAALPQMVGDAPVCGNFLRIHQGAAGRYVYQSLGHEHIPLFLSYALSETPPIQVLNRTPSSTEGYHSPGTDKSPQFTEGQLSLVARRVPYMTCMLAA